MSQKYKLTVKEGNWSTHQDLFVAFTYCGQDYYTMPKDGEGRHCIWDQKFELPFNQ